MIRGRVVKVSSDIFASCYFNGRKSEPWVAGRSDWCPNLAAYAVGMVLTFVVLVLMKKGQPALLYLVPCTLITASVVAWRRKEMKKFWDGSSYQMMNYSASEENPVTTDDRIAQQ